MSGNTLERWYQQHSSPEHHQLCTRWMRPLQGAHLYYKEHPDRGRRLITVVRLRMKKMKRMNIWFNQI
jgi:hypothetical protein